VNAEEVTTLAPGDQIWRWVVNGSSGGGAHDQAAIVVMTVVRVNRRTVTATNGYGEKVYLPHHVIEGRVDWEE
jgi:hypothetical protein